jgi:hypothetical protein
MRNPKNLKKRRITQRVGYRDFGYREMEKSETLNIRSLEVLKYEISETDTSTNHVSKPCQLRTRGTIRQ